MPNNPTSSNPVWKSPGWITAMVAVISAFLTIPQIISDVLVSNQKIKTIQLENERIKQTQEFHIIQNTLAQQGTERVFLLRYFAATLDDVDAKNWAIAEVTKLNTYIEKEKDKVNVKSEIVTKQEELEKTGLSAEDKDKLNKKISELKNEFVKQDIEVDALRQQAGVAQHTAAQQTAEVRRYWVVVGSFSEREKAQQLVEKIQSETTELRPFVGIRGGSGLLPVIVGSGTYNEARKLVEKALRLQSVTNEPYLSAY